MIVHCPEIHLSDPKTCKVCAGRGMVQVITAAGFPVTVPEMQQLAAEIGEKTMFGRNGGAPTFALGMSPAGSLDSTVEDLGRFLSVLSAGGSGAGERASARWKKVTRVIDGKVVGSEEARKKAEKAGRFDYDAPMEGLQALERELSALDAKLLTLQQPGIENAARGLVERPAAQMLQEVGHCKGIENYTRHLSGAAPGGVRRRGVARDPARRDAAVPG